MKIMKKRMIMTRTPLRITFVGGGTDLSSYYKKNGPGAVVNAAINKYIYVIVNKKFDNGIRLSYSKTEIVNTVNEIKHPTVREALKLLDITGGIEIVSISDIPSGGTGLGSSSSFLVGLLNALHAWKGESVSPKQLAEEAIKIKINILNEAEGKQDEYIAAYGGIRFMKFNSDESVVVNQIKITEETKNLLKRNLQLLYTGKQRSAPEMLNAQSSKVNAHLKEYTSMRDLAYVLYSQLTKNNWAKTGEMLHKNWVLKKMLNDNISDKLIDSWYKRGIDAGAIGGKMIGAGGGGFLLLFTPPKKHNAVRKALPELREERFEFEAHGSSIIYVGD